MDCIGQLLLLGWLQPVSVEVGVEDLTTAGGMEGVVLPVVGKGVLAKAQGRLRAKAQGGLRAKPKGGIRSKAQEELRKNLMHN